MFDVVILTEKKYINPKVKDCILISIIRRQASTKRVRKEGDESL